MNEIRLPLLGWVLGLCIVLGIVGVLPVALALDPIPMDLPAQAEGEDDDDEDAGGGEDEDEAADAATYLEELAEPESGATEVTEKRLSPGELRELEERLEILSDQIFKSRAKLQQLRDQLEYTTVSVINVAITHTQATSAAFRLLSVGYNLDGFDLYHATAANEPIGKAKRLPIFEGSLVPGEHLLVVDLYYQGRGFGVFSYLNNYTFHVKSRYMFVVEEGEAFDLDVTAFDRAEFFAALKDRLKVKFVRVSRNEE